MTEAAIVLAVLAILVSAAIYFAPKGWRTIAANVVAGGAVVLGTLLDALSGFDWREVLPPDYAAYVVLAMTILNLVLRVVTTTPIGQRGDPPDA